MQHRETSAETKTEVSRSGRGGNGMERSRNSMFYEFKKIKKSRRKIENKIFGNFDFHGKKIARWKKAAHFKIFRRDMYARALMLRF